MNEVGDNLKSMYVIEKFSSGGHIAAWHKDNPINPFQRHVIALIGAEGKAQVMYLDGDADSLRFVSDKGAMSKATAEIIAESLKKTGMKVGDIKYSTSTYHSKYMEVLSMHAESRRCQYCRNTLGPNGRIFLEPYVCNSCLNLKYTECKECGTLIKKKENERNVVDELEETSIQYICRDCIRVNYLECHVCGNHHSNLTAHSERTMHGASVYPACPHCRNDPDNDYCDGCGRWFHVEDLGSADMNGQDFLLCSECEEEHFLCDICGDMHHERDLSAHNPGVCDQCANSQPDASIRDYAFTPSVLRKLHTGDEDKTPLMGVELEVESQEYDPQDIASELFDISELLYFKEDGSLSESGVEIVSHPLSFDFHMKCMDWGKILKTARDLGGRSHDTTTCGLHIHVDQNMMGKTRRQRVLTTGRLLLTLERFNSQFKKLSRRRGGNTYCQDNKRKIFKNTDHQRHDVIREGKYRMINTSRSDTIEFRLWRGTLNESSFYAALEITYLMCMWSKDKMVMEIDKAGWEDFVKYCVDNARTKHVASYIEERCGTNSEGETVCA